ncbi:hypothetical protein PN36_34605, partial [Candidatus Thiomargarita nelsonii]
KMEKTYTPHAIEQHWYKTWEEKGYFTPKGTDTPYCIMIPPPNVTGTLHINAIKLRATIKDCLQKYFR